MIILYEYADGIESKGTDMEEVIGDGLGIEIFPHLLPR